MSYAVKYQYSFKSFENDDCVVYFFVKDYSGGITILDPGASPFILREFNTDRDFFKPIRGFQAEMQVLATPSISLEDFVFNEDDSVLVQFFVNGDRFWIGYLMNDDIQEDWIDTFHYITLRATDGLGQIQGAPVTTIDGQADIEEYLSYAIASTPIPNFIGTVIVNNLFYDGMQDKADGNFHPLNQVDVDGKTFEGLNNQEILERVNRAWGQTIYQYRGVWWIARQEEFIHNNTIRGITKGIFSNNGLNKDFTVNIGVDESIKPVAPLMLRTIRRPFKETRINYRIEYPRELFCNQSFLNGDVILPTTNTFTIDCWTLLKGAVNAPVAGTTDWYRKEERDVDDNITDNYVYFEKDTTQHWMKSQPITLNQDDKIVFSVDFRAQGAAASGQANIAIAMLQFEPFTGSTYYTLNDDGDWIPTNTSYSTNVKRVNMSYAAGESLLTWKNLEVRTKGVPAPGRLYVSLFNTMTSNPFRDANFKGLEVQIRESSFIPGVLGDFDKYTLTETIRQNYEEQIYLDDSNNRSHKGALFYSGNLTGDNWYRYDYPSERLTFKRHNAIAKMLLNRRNRYQLEVNMLGLKYPDNGTDRIVWLMNKFVFVDDAPNKQFMITNLSEMDFYNSTWKANLIEVWDSSDDDSLVNYPEHSFGNIYQRDVN